jgi:hypothetical protein
MNTRSLLFPVLVVMAFTGALACGGSDGPSVDAGDARADWVGPGNGANGKDTPSATDQAGRTVDANPAESLPRFVQASYATTLPMGYAKETRVAITGGKAGTWIVARVDVDLDDLALGFVGPGSEDDPLELGMKSGAEMVLSITSPDATKKNYQIPIGLYLLVDPSDDIATATKVSSAVVDLTLRFPVVSLEVKKVNENPASLAQTWQVVNQGDDVSDLYIVGRGLLASQMTITPQPDHVELLAGKIFEFVVTPALFPGMKSLSGLLEIQAADQVQTAPVTFAVPAGKKVFIGFGASGFGQESGGSFCSNQGCIRLGLGRGPRRPKAPDPDTSGPDFWSKKGMADAFAKATGEGMAAGKAIKTVGRASWLTVPFIALDAVFKGITKIIGRDPPDPNYKVVALPDLRTPTTVSADDATELTQEAADALNALVANGTLIADLGRAIVATQDKLGGAQAAADIEWVRKHEIVYRAYAAMMAERTRVHADLYDAFVDVAPSWFGIPFADDVITMQEALAATGFDADELATFKAMGLTDAEVAEMKADILAADPDKVAALSFTDLVNRLWNDDDDWPLDLGRVFELCAMGADQSLPSRAEVLVRYELESPRAYISPHTTRISLNDSEIATLSMKVPEGIYLFPVDVTKVKFFGALPSGNEIQLLSEGFNEGDFVRTLDVTLYTHHAVHGELVVATTQDEANTFAAKSLLMNHDKPDLVILANKLPAFDADAFDGSKAISLLLSVYNIGEAASAATTLSVFGADPRLGDPGPSLLPTVAVPGIEPLAQTDATVVLPTSLLTSDTVPERLFISVGSAGAQGDFQLPNNTMAFDLR